MMKSYIVKARVGRGARGIALAASLCVLAGGCVPSSNVQESRAAAPRSFDPALQGPVAGLGIEAHDIVSMTDQMMRDILASPAFQQSGAPPRVIIDSAFFVNDSLQAINKNAITDRLRINLNRAAQGRLMFVGRQYARMVEQERDLKRTGTTDVGTAGMTKAQYGGDYRLGGRIVSLDQINPQSGQMQRYNQVTFEMVDLETSAIVWGGIYEFARAAREDIIYR